MIGLMMLLIAFGYLALSVALVRRVTRWAHRGGRRAWTWGLAAGFLLYNLVLWDFIPATQLQRYYCANEAGLWIHKSPDQWRAEHPEEAARLTYEEMSDMEKVEGGHAYHLNERIDWVSTVSPIWPEVRRYEERLIDSGNGELLVHEVYFECGLCGRAPDSILDYRFWMNRCECALEKRRVGGGFSPMVKQFKKIGGDFSHAR